MSPLFSGVRFLEHLTQVRYVYFQGRLEHWRDIVHNVLTPTGHHIPVCINDRPKVFVHLFGRMEHLQRKLDQLTANPVHHGYRHQRRTVVF